MNIPLTRDEIAEFLNVTKIQVERIWSQGLLKRTIGCHHRPSGAIMHSSPFDALEYGLASGDLPKRLSTDQAAMWIFCLAELTEFDDYLSSDHRTQSFLLHDAAQEEGIAGEREDSNEIAAVVVSKYWQLGEIMDDTDKCVSETH